MNPRYARFLAVPVACAAFGSFSGCIATSSEMSYLRDDIAQLQMKLTEVQRNQADLSVKMDSMSGSMGALTAELQETQNSMSLMSQRLDDVEANITQRVAQMTGAPASAAPAPSDLYRAAYSDFSGGKFDLAITGFRTYLDKNPKGELAAQAQYYIGECYYSQNDWEKALPEFELVEHYYPKSDAVPSARLKQALCMEQLDKIRDASDVLNALVKDYPASPEAFTAREKLKAFLSDGK